MRHSILSVLTIAILFFSCTDQNREKSTSALSEKEFADPGIINRPLAFYDWLNGYVDTARLVYELEQMKEKGMQGAFIWDVGALMDPKNTIPVGPKFLDEESLGYISIAMRKAGELGLNMGMIASSSWNAGGSWIDDAEGAKELLSSTVQVTGPGKQTIRIERPSSRRGIPEIYSLLRTVAVPYSESKEIDYASDEVVVIEDESSYDLVIEWDVPQGKWEVISFFMCNTRQHLACPSPNSDGLMIDHLSRQATKIHFDTIIERLAEASANAGGHQLKYLEVDSYEVWSADDWTPGFIEEFKNRYGYDPVPYLPLLTGYERKNHELGERFRGDYTRLISDLMIENHFAQGKEMSNENGMLLFAEAGHGGFPRVDPLKAFGRVDVPMGEFWNRHRFWVTKEAASGAHIYGKKLVASETLTGWNHWQHGPTDYKQLCDIAFCEGLNQIFFHTFAHNPEVVGVPGAAYHAGEHINVNTTWWEMARPFMDYLSRCSYMLRQGNFVADACLYYGDQAPNLVPPKRVDPNYGPGMRGYPEWFGDDDKCLHCGLPKPVNPGDMQGYDYDYMNAEVITEHMRVEDGKLVLPSGLSYRVMLLPDREDISLDVLKRIEQLVSDGAIIIGSRPDRATSLENYPECDDEVKEIAERLWGDCDGESVFSHSYGKGTIYCGKTVKEVLEELGIAPDVDVQGIDNSDWIIDYIHHKTDHEDFYYLSNTSEASQDITCVFRVDKNMVPELWDPVSGLIQREVDYKKVKNGISIDFVMDPLASRFVVFRKHTTGKNDEGLAYDLQYGFSNKQVEEVATVNITNDWKLRFQPDMGAPSTYQLDKLKSWTEIEDKGINYYSGKTTYSREFMVEENMLSEGTEAWVVFDDIQEMARVNVNGKDCGVVWVPPYQVRITPYLEAGENTITVEVINVWNNRIVGDMRNPDQEPYTRTNAKATFSANTPLRSSGLIGEAAVRFLN